MCFPDGTQALDSIDLDVGIGEFVSLVGPSGCGKSTILRLLAGFESPTGGRVLTEGAAPGYVFQDPTLLPWRTVCDNVGLPAELDGASRRRARAIALPALARVGLSDFADHMPAQLSGGMRMRVSIARALTATPSLFLFDEPFGALDEITRQRLNEEVARLFVEQPFGGVFVTHSVSEAVYLSTRVVVMSGRPGGVIADIEVPFGYPRPPEIRFDHDFSDLGRRVSDALRSDAEAAA